jgi:hypothetical protein
MRQWYRSLAGSLALSMPVVVIALWIWSHVDERPNRLVAGTGHGRWLTFRSEAGRLSVAVGPPPASSKHAGDELRDLASAIRNDDYLWRASWGLHPRTRDWKLVTVSPTVVTYDGPLQGFSRYFARSPSGRSLLKGEARAPLVAALDDPQRFVAAHLMLTSYVRDAGHGVSHEVRGDVILCNFEGLQVELVGKERPTGPPSIEGRDVDYAPPTSVRIDPAQRWSLRDHWRALLEVERFSVRYAWVAPFTLILPAIYGRAAIRRRRRLRRGLCPGCGYDLRATPPGAACPECGRAVGARADGASAAPEGARG